jgi:hypothetical protein
VTAARFWSDDFDTDLLKVIQRAAGVLDQVTARLWTYGHVSHGRLNHPSVWHTQLGPVAYFGTDTTGGWKPDHLRTDGRLVECTWTEVARDAWVHDYLIVVDYELIWDAHRHAGTFMKLMYDLRGIRVLPGGEADRLRGEVLASLIAATTDLQDHAPTVLDEGVQTVPVDRPAVPEDAAVNVRCPECRCNPTLCESDDSGEHCADSRCPTCLDGCPLDECPACPVVR